MKYSIGFLMIAALFASHAAWAQSPAPLTRAQVLDELYRLEAAGYNPSAGDEGSYPADIQAAQARVDAQQAAQAAASGAPAAGMATHAGK
ncbi:DUF4148 domain-containing protein [Burkholderia stagnalis]|uniref:DUF4148 domain-containing protein n=1 Tax=Burkholderia stagnalis TaxID=1503054 RepID=UPI000F59038A|nr:DUF4148 domain-containing protein [Burkholderia stagnalis]RQQ10823.1 DUF4148 domain-containing protein [Burkholderia stagnalis]RQQ37792.1 DUF4148 domain-containing protein [Burkholderia stagnalis]RQY41581.1 DUF4148 domain-containing protein [Burkholderia stagnalis]RQY60849.1 DUF4148 domain-containing protein [Burkholderia stagnalis]RQY72472.1 DUF4148 domain-containing protein [Burkholderia stagnalis]